MEYKDRKVCYKQAIEKWGIESQYDQMIEEMAELIVAFNKLKRAGKEIAQKKDGVLENVYEELADVKMCLEQMEYIFGSDNINNMLEEKMKKFKSQLDE